VTERAARESNAERGVPKSEGREPGEKAEGEVSFLRISFSDSKNSVLNGQERFTPEYGRPTA